MIDKSGFRNLAPADLGWSGVPAEPDFAYEAEWMTLAGRTGTGASFRQGRRTKNQLVQLESGITLPELLAEMRAVPTFQLSQTLMASTGALMTTYDPAEEARMLARVLMLLDLPLKPWSAVGEVVAAFHPHCPRLMWTKPLLIEGKGVPGGTYDRRLMALRDGLMYEAFFRQDKLRAVTVTDLELIIRNDAMEGIGKARKAAFLIQKLSDLELDPVPAALKMGFRASREMVEWSRGIDLPALAPEPEDFRLDLPEGLAGMDVVDLHVNDLGRALRAAGSRQVHEQLEDHYSSLRDMLEQTADANLFSDCISRCFSPDVAENAHPNRPGLGRAAWVLIDLYSQIMDGGGLEGWFTTCLDSAHDTMAALRLIGAAEMDQFLCGFAARAAEDSCDILSVDSWRAYFERDPRDEDEVEALRLAPAIMPHFRKWALSSPEVTSAAESAWPEARGAPISVPTRGRMAGLMRMPDNTPPLASDRAILPDVGGMRPLMDSRTRTPG